jgi:hypothetical protein
MNESMPVTPLSSEGQVSSPGEVVEDEDFEPEGEVTLVKRNTGKGYRYQRKGEVVHGQDGQEANKERRSSSSSSSSQERKRQSAAEKVEQSRIKVRAARLAEQEQKEREEQEQRRVQEEEWASQSGGSSRRGSADPVVSYAQQMQQHMLALMKGMEQMDVKPGFVQRRTNNDDE